MAERKRGIRANIDESFAPDPLEAALMDVARAIQLTPTMHREATARYEALARHVDRDGSPLQDRVDEVYPSGSFAIHAATRSEIKREQHDADAVLELLIDEDDDPETVLDELHDAITNTSNVTYRGLRVERNSRCVTVHYTDGMTVDLMPVVRLSGTPERVANLFHHKAETGESYHKEVNPKGFASQFNATVEQNEAFARRFDTRRFLVEGKTYAERFAPVLDESYELLAEKAETQPMPDYLPLDQKSPRVVALQLLKRFRDKRYRKHDSHKGRRKPPSVVMAALALSVPPTGATLTDELIAIATAMRDAIVSADRTGMRLEVRNPCYWPDIFTDRWPEDQEAQRLWRADLDHMLSELKHLRTTGFAPVSIKRVFDDLFGSEIGDHVLEEHAKVQNRAVLDGKSLMAPDGTVRSPAMPSPASVRTPQRAAAAAAASASISSGLIRPARANTGMGGVIPDDDD